MVLKETQERKAVENSDTRENAGAGESDNKDSGKGASKSKRRILYLVLGTIIAFEIGALIAVPIIRNNRGANEGGEAGNSSETTGEVEEEPLAEEPVIPAIPDAVDLQAVVDEWAEATGGKKGIYIYDLDRGEAAAAYNSDTEFATASLYKLFPVYLGYTYVDNGTWDGEDTAGGTGRSILECLDLAIRESNSPCAETLWGMLGRDEVDAYFATIFNDPDFTIQNLKASPFRIYEVLKLYYNHPDVTKPELVATMLDSFLNQPVTTYDWRSGLPSGISDAVKVYNKVGWEFDPDANAWAIYDDAAILDFTEKDRHFIAVVMTNWVSNVKIRELGGMIEAAVRG